MEISDRVAVMRDGKLVATRDTARTNESELVSLIVGKALAAALPKAAVSADAQAVLALQGVASGNAGPVSFTVRRGEVVGLVGLRGAGQEAISRALFGREPLSAGSLRVLDRPVRLDSPAQAIAAGVAYVAGERLDENLAGSMSVLENLFPNPALRGERGLDAQRRQREHEAARGLIRLFDVNPPSPEAEVQQLSGGNQQKVVLARWFHLDKPLVVLEEPTAGVDVGAKRQIYELLRQRAEAGTALVVVSTDFEEIATVCTRVLVFRAGAIAAELQGAEITVARLLALAAGAAADKQTEPLLEAA
jgi:ribose transport system ATP-binding protein